MAVPSRAANEIRNCQAQPDNRDKRLGQRASKRRGLVVADDLRAVGMNREAVRVRVTRGQMHPLFPGVWAWGHRALTREAWWLAAVLSVGDARLDGTSACQLYEVFRRRVGRIHVVTRRSVGSRDRLKVRRAKRLPRMQRRKGIPVVPIEEALLGLAADEDVTDQEVRSALRRSLTEKHTTIERLRAHVERAGGRPGIRRMRRLLGEGGLRSKSALEAAAAGLLHRYGIAFDQNVEVDGEEADLVLGDLIVELDSEGFHDNPIAAQDDQRKHEVWTANGRPVERLTWDDVHLRPVKTIRRLTARVASHA